MFHIVLVEPEIPPNTGNVIRLAANTGCDLYLLGKLGFSLDDKHMRRAGLDYHEYVNVRHYTSWSDFKAAVQPEMRHLFALTSHGTHNLFERRFSSGDWLVFGAETHGLSEDIRRDIGEAHALRLPMIFGQRCLNLSNAVAVTVYEAWRQNNFSGAQTAGIRG